MHFDYLQTSTALTIAAEPILGIAVLVLAGSINDYATFATVGMIVVGCALML